MIDENLFTGPIGEEYHLLELLCPTSAHLPRRAGEFLAGWRKGEAIYGLEVGCGSGVSTVAYLAARPDLTLVGIDASEAMLAQARRNLAAQVEAKRVDFVETDALAYLRAQPEAAFDLVISNYAFHNFLEGYRREALAEVRRVLKPGGLFLNGDRYAVDDRAAHLALTQDLIRHWFKVFAELGRLDLLEEWVVHFFSDESDAHIMWFTPALERMKALGFEDVTVHWREGVDTLLTATRPA